MVCGADSGFYSLTMEKWLRSKKEHDQRGRDIYSKTIDIGRYISIQLYLFLVVRKPISKMIQVGTFSLLFFLIFLRRSSFRFKDKLPIFYRSNVVLIVLKVGRNLSSRNTSDKLSQHGRTSPFSSGFLPTSKWSFVAISGCVEGLKQKQRLLEQSSH